MEIESQSTTSELSDEGECLYVTTDDPERPKAEVATKTGDNRLRAIVCINVWCVAFVGQSILFKKATHQGVAVVDYQVFRNVSLLGTSLVDCYLRGTKPWGRDFPTQFQSTIFVRCLMGQLSWFIQNLSFTLIPMTFVVIIMQTASFWTSILARFFFLEPLYAVEIVAMCVCFVSVLYITVSRGDALKHQKVESTSVSAAWQTAGFILISCNCWVYAAVCCLCRQLKSVPTSVIIFWHGICGLSIASTYLVGSSLLSSAPVSLLHHSSSTYLLLVGAALIDSLGTFTWTAAY